MIRKNDMEDIDTFNEDQVVCPYCKHIQMDSEEFLMGNWIGLEHDTTGYCGECGKEFEVTINLEPTYSTYKMEENK